MWNFGFGANCFLANNTVTSNEFTFLYDHDSGFGPDGYAVQNRFGSNCDYAHTATITLGTLPSGVTYTSDSGTFLAGGVPEPGTRWLAGCPLALGLARLRRARRN